MFSSLASFIFGSNTSATTNSETNPFQLIGEQREQNQNQNQNQNQRQRQRQLTKESDLLCIDAENTIHVTSSTPSVTGCQNNESISLHRQKNLGEKRNNGKSKRNKNSRNKRQQIGVEAKPSIAKLLTPNESCDEDLDEADWFIVEKEDEEDSLPRTDSEEELSVVEVKGAVQPLPSTGSSTQSTSGHRRQHINSHTVYSGPRPHKQRNFLQRARINARNDTSLKLPTLNPPRNIIDAGINAGIVAASCSATADVDCITQSLYVARPKLSSSAAPSSALSLISCVNGNDGGANIGMEESWFVTPPPCFTSIGPINMETSPYENLLIEHPSMSVYHSIRSAKEAAETFVNLELGVERQPRLTESSTDIVAVSATIAVETINTGRNVQTRASQQGRGSSIRSDRFSAAQLKQELMARNSQNSYDMKERQYLCRGAIKRSNKVRDFQSKANRQRRSDMQHCKIVSGANNNRKCNF